MRKTVRKSLKLLTSATLILAGTLLLLEVGVRFMADNLGVSPYMHYSETLGWSARPNTVKHHRDRAGQFDVQYSINQYGFRGPAYPVERSRGIYRIMVLGDSTGFGWGVSENYTFAGILDRELERTEVINLALSGYGTDQSLIRFIEEGLTFKPDLVVLQVSHNDFEEIMHPFFNQKPKPVFELDESGELALTNVPARAVGERARFFHTHSLPLPFKEWLGWNSYSYNLLNELYYGLMRPQAQDATLPPSIFTDQSVAMFNRIARLLQSRIDAIGARGIVVYSNADISTNGYVSADHLQRLDLYPAFLDACGEKAAKCYFSDGYHWNVTGHRVAADNLKREILSLRSAARFGS